MIESEYILDLEDLLKHLSRVQDAHREMLNKLQEHLDYDVERLASYSMAFFSRHYGVDLIRTSTQSDESQKMVCTVTAMKEDGKTDEEIFEYIYRRSLELSLRPKKIESRSTSISANLADDYIIAFHTDIARGITKARDLDERRKGKEK